ncbi:coronin-6 isoform X2 [Synchiropus splendidus]|uniref:coronin-6 isoform X2 n=1 Tax=Synchiropus splendidus TaxID=270530 RepID=UPI00237E6B5F|nr:coronin-6 isoform X2 [Synchiropus splendidus]
MSRSIVRQSKFRHVFGQSVKAEQSYDDIRVSKVTWDSSFCAVNPKFLAVIVESSGGGAFLVLPLSKTGRVDKNYPLVIGHSGPVLDIDWCPHDDNILASGSEDCTAMVWQIPDHSLSRPLSDPVVVLEGHSKRVGIVSWHPTARNILLTAGSDNLVMVWNVGTGEAVLVLDDHPDLIYSVSWNRNGSLFCTTCKDRRLRVCDPRKREVVAVSWPPGAIAAAQPRCSSRVSSSGAPGSTRGDPAHESHLHQGREHLHHGLHQDESAGAGPVGPGKWAPLTGAPRPTSPSWLLLHRPTSRSPSPCWSWTPATACCCPTTTPTPTWCTCAGRLYKLHDKKCEPITMTVPRKSDLFQDDLYPDTAGPDPAMEAEEWLDGRDEEPILVSMREGYVPPKSRELKVARKNMLDSRPTTRRSISTCDSNTLPVSQVHFLTPASGLQSLHSHRPPTFTTFHETPRGHGSPRPSQSSRCEPGKWLAEVQAAAVGREF